MNAVQVEACETGLYSPLFLHWGPHPETWVSG